TPGCPREHVPPRAPVPAPPHCSSPPLAASGHGPPGRPWTCPTASRVLFPAGPSCAQPEEGAAMGRQRLAPALLAAFKALLILPALLAPSQAVVRAVLEDNASTVDFADLPALFGAPLAPEGVRGYLMEARPANACQPIEGPQPGNRSLGAIVLIRRYDCPFDLKVLHAQRAGFEAAIVHNVRSDDLVHMAHVYEDLRGEIAIPSVFVGEAASQDLRVIVRCDKSAHVLLLPDRPPCPDLDCHPVLAVSWVLGRSLALATSVLLVLRRLWLWVRAWWARGPAVKAPACRKAQVRTFTRRHDLCAICLDEYEEGDQLKILPCSHAYHCKCIDPWLAQAAWRSCPVCKQSVAGTEDGSDSTVDSVCDGDPSLPGHRPPIWAIQARLRSRRLELLARAGPCGRCSPESLAPAEATAPLGQ
uniref:E3 ubiquitin-protein ligase ZNRF4 n=1 Tax=Propithecus coquereli TaxID=379532 RepID=A0A2K6FDB9_PROCO